MSLILIISIAIRLAAMGWSIMLLRRIRDWRMGFLTAMLGFMALRQTLTMLAEKESWEISISGHAAELPGLVVSVMALLATFFLARIITERVRAEAGRHKSEARLATVLNIAADAIITVDQDQRILHFNQGAEQIFGYRAEEVLTKPLHILLPARFAQTHRQHIRIFAASPKFARQMGELSPEIFGRRKDGSEFPADASIAKLVQEGQPVYTVILRDITGRVRLEEELHKRREANIKLTVLAQERRELQEWINTFDTFVGKFDLNGIGILFNKTPLKAGGVTKDDVVGKYFPDAKWWSHSEIERARVVECFEKAKAGLSSRIETNFRSADGTPVPIIFNCQPVIDDDGKVEYITAEGKTIIEETRLRTELQEAKETLEIRVKERTSELAEANEKLKNEIAERTQTAQTLRQKVNDLAALYEASQVFLGQSDVETILEDTCRLAVEHFGLKMAWVGLVVEGNYNVHPAAAYGFEEGYLRSIHITWDDSPAGRGPTGAAIRTAQAVSMNRIETDPAYAPWRAAALDRGYRSSAALPLLYGEEALGALNVYSPEPEYFTADWLQVLQSLANLAAIALQNARLFDQVQRHAAELEQRVAERTEELRRRRDELTILYETSLNITLATDLELVLERIAEAACSVAQADIASILLYDERLDHFSVSATVGWKNGPIKDQRYQVRPDGMTRHILRQREPVIVADALDYPDIHPMVLDAGMRSLLAMPVEQRQHLLGVIYVNAQAPGAFVERHLTALRLFANQAAVAIENARLLQRQQIEARRLRTLNELMVGIVGAHALDKTLDGIAQATVDLLDCDMAAVALYDPVADEIRIPVEYGHRGFSRAFVEQYRLPSGEGAGGKAFAEGRVSVIPDTQAEGAMIDREQAEQAGIRAMLVGPLQTPERKLGALYANQRHPYPFSEDEVALFSILAGQAAMAIENIRLYETLQVRSHKLATSLEELERQYRRQAALAEIELAINQPQELRTVLNRITEVVTETLPATVGASVVLWDDEAEAFSIASATVITLGETQTAAYHVRREGGATRWIVERRQPLIVTDVQDDPFGDNPLLAQFGIRAYAGVPLLDKGFALGVLYALDKAPRQYTSEEMAFLTTLASRAAVAITKVRLYEQAQTLAALEERQRLARELHDVVSQSLFSASVIAETLPRLWDRDPQTVQNGLNELHRLTHGALAEMRTLLLELRPQKLEKVALHDLLHQLTQSLAGRMGTAVSLSVTGSHLLPPETHLAFYRIAQEALNNIAKHASASAVTVRFDSRPEQTTLHIRDDGRGFNPEEVFSEHLGLNIMQERTRDIGARLKITSELERGTEIMLTWLADQGNKNNE